jgi:transcriptional regulator with XRE-family HTH domain
MDLTRIRALREDNDKTQQEIADLLCIKQTTKYELGRVAIPIDALMTLADFYGVSLDYLAGRSDEKGK